MSQEYQEFLKRKSQTAAPVGFDANHLSSDLFDFQKAVIRWACKRGRAAIFAGTGLGKSFKELSWAHELYEAEKKPVLIFTPLAVAGQMVNVEAKKFGIDAKHVSESTNDPIQVTNYQKIDHFDLSKYSGVVLDESSILKNHSGHFRTRLIEECAQIPYRLAATATPSPNDYMELGNHSQFCGIMSYTDMLSTFFVHDAAKTQDWRLKGHAEDEFWKWMATWSVMYQNPSDLGFDGDAYNLPKLHQIEHIVKADYASCNNSGLLFPVQAHGMSDRLKIRRDTIIERVNKAAEIVNEDQSKTWVVWCNLNDESAMATDKIKGAVEVKGSDKDDKKEKILEDFANGNIRVLVTKPSICGFGMNWQHCNNTCFVGLNDSFEQIYQAIRRFWRFGQKNEVYAHFIASELEGAVLSNIRRKEKQSQHMMNKMVAYMKDLNTINVQSAARQTSSYKPQEKMELPSWL